MLAKKIDSSLMHPLCYSATGKWEEFHYQSNTMSSASFVFLQSVLPTRSGEEVAGELFRPCWLYLPACFLTGRCKLVLLLTL